MRSESINLKEFQRGGLEFEQTTSKMNLSEVFKEKNFSFLNIYALFIAHFNSIPNAIPQKDINCRKANRWFAETYKTEIKDKHYNKRYYRGKNMPEPDDIYYMLYDDLIVYFDTGSSEVRYLFRKTEVSKVEKVIDEIKKFREKKRRKPEISILVYTNDGIKAKSMEITRPKLNLEDNYNDDFKEIHQAIMKRLTKKKDKGLVLLHGNPGTGKTSYIRYLISSLKKAVIFLPPNMAGEITNPELITILIDNPNSIFVIEDAEKIVVDREKEGSSAVSALLNISDGLLSDCLNIQIICTFNTDISKVDSALLRKGRLIAKYEFKELATEKAKALSEKLGYTTEINSPMTLTDIYNQEEENYQEKRRNRIGFIK